MREIDKGKVFLVTRNGIPVAELAPVRQRAFVSAEAAQAAFAGAPRIRRLRFRKEVDAFLDQDATPRG
jgi:antitoxin (DNA-binding transcriptional repressor) of toxin-antitoxin stability system